MLLFASFKGARGRHTTRTPLALFALLFLLVGGTHYLRHDQELLEASPKLRSTVKAPNTWLVGTLDVPGEVEAIQIPNLPTVVLIEVGTLVICQAIGLPLLMKLGRVPMLWLRQLSRAKQLRLLRMAKLWKTMVAGYSKTSASKIVNRAKKSIHVFHHGEEEQRG